MSSPDTKNVSEPPVETAPENQPVKESRPRRAARGRMRATLVSGGIILLAACAVILIGFVLPGLSRDVPPSTPPPVNVRVMPVRPLATMPDTFDLPAVVEPNEVVNVAAEVSAKVKDYGLLVPATGPDQPGQGRRLKEGDRIVKGQTIIHLDTDILKAELDQAEAQARFDEQEKERITSLYRAQRRLASEQEYNLAISKAALSKAALDAAITRYERANIVAPLDGVLNKLPVKVGEYVQPGTVVAEVVDDSRAKIVLQMPERDVRFFKPGQTQQILPMNGVATTQQDQEHVISGPITYISQLADPLTRTTRVEITVANGKHFHHGEIVTVRLLRRVLHDVVLIPLEAVIPTEFETNGQKIRLVYVVEPAKSASGPATTAPDGQPEFVARERRITLGFFKGRNAQVTSGLAGGEKLIVSGHRFVSDGQPVKIVAMDSPAQ